jgi:hypothetical protein
MELVAVLLAVLALLCFFYAFGFQRVTRAIIQTRTGLAASSPAGQELTRVMTPWWVGALGWIGTIAGFVAFGLLWVAFGWGWAVAYAVGSLLGAFLPYGLLRRHYALIILPNLAPLFQRAAAGDDPELQGVVNGLVTECILICEGRGAACELV